MIFLWTPIGAFYNLLGWIRGMLCPKETVVTAQRSITQETELERAQSIANANSTCWHCQACVNRNVVNVHYTHRFLESAAEIVFILISNSVHSAVTTQYTLPIEVIATVSTIAVPILYLTSRQWLIIGDENSGIEMTIFGFLRQAHISKDLDLLSEFVARVPKSVNERKKINGRTPVLECIELKNYEIFDYLCQTNKIKLGLSDNDGVTPLILSCRHGLTKFLELLLERKEKFRWYDDVDCHIDLEAQFAFNK
ncbi:hypothetical protein RFI_18625, partial [Reticulomyxa filosa]